MIKKIIQVVLVCFLICFSFYYTEKSVDLVKYTDPIMKEIKNNATNYKVQTSDALVTEDEVLPGYNGLEVDYESSYQAMKRIGQYDKDRLVLKETTPKVSIKDHYDKYIIKGNYLKDTVGLVFLLDEKINVNQITNVLDAKGVTATFITTNKYLEDNPKIIYELAKADYEIELTITDEDELVLARNTLKNIINYSGEYCYLEEKNENVLKICEKSKMHSILPTFSVSSFKDLKDHLESGAIIKINNNEIKELSTIINYIKQRGYTLENLTYLLSEDRIEK